MAEFDCAWPEHERKERPILFSGPMVRAILAGQKTQTRRVVKGFEKCGHGRPEFLRMRDGLAVFGDSIPDDPVPLEVTCPYGRVGDFLWVRETHRMAHATEPLIWYRADDEIVNVDVPAGGETVWESGNRWRPSIHMPRWACRIVLQVVGVTVDRVQRIEELDALAEGCIGKIEEGVLNGVRGQYVVSEARDEFRALWDQINAKRGYGWDINPWVWVVAFRRAI